MGMKGTGTQEGLSSLLSKSSSAVVSSSASSGVPTGKVQRGYLEGSFRIPGPVSTISCRSLRKGGAFPCMFFSISLRLPVSAPVSAAAQGSPLRRRPVFRRRE